jgi:hypothetical protein
MEEVLLLFKMSTYLQDSAVTVGEMASLNTDEVSFKEGLHDY